MECLSSNIQKYETQSKSGDKAQDKLSKDIIKAYKLVQGLFVFTMYTFHPKNFQEVFSTA